MYTAEAKHVLAGIDPAVLETAGVVSRAASEGLARGIRERSRADLGLAVTGWAGPESDGPDPVGCVYLAVATEDAVQSVRERYDGEREAVRERAASALLALALEAVRTMEPREP